MPQNASESESAGIGLVAREAEVEDERLAALVDDDVRGLHVAVEDLLVVRVREGVGDLDRDAEVRSTWDQEGEDPAEPAAQSRPDRGRRTTPAEAGGPADVRSGQPEGRRSGGRDGRR